MNGYYTVQVVNIESQKTDKRDFDNIKNAFDSYDLLMHLADDNIILVVTDTYGNIIESNFEFCKKG
jgi:Holliday junction resolvase RusA-like endonuclease